jgi:hypothetical protein
MFGIDIIGIAAIIGSVLVAALFLYLALHKSDLSVIEGNKPEKKKENRHLP